MISGFDLAKYCGYFLVVINLFLVPYLLMTAFKKVWKKDNDGNKIVKELPGADYGLVAAVLKSLKKPKQKLDEATKRIIMPKFAYVQRDVAIDLIHVNQYNKICGFPTNFKVPITYPYCLIFPLQLLLLTDPEFPFPAMGTVHMANRIRQFLPILCQDVTIKVRAAEEITYFKQQKSGYIFKVISTLSNSNNELLWECESTYLSLTKKENKEGYKPFEYYFYKDGATEFKGKEVSSWNGSDLKANMGRKYAAISGDYNPIHLYPFTAKALGMPAVLMHGMFTKAAALAAVCGGNGEKAFCLNSKKPADGSPIAEIFVEFKRPLTLPKRAVLASKVESSEVKALSRETTSFEVSSTSKKGDKESHIQGYFWSL